MESNKQRVDYSKVSGDVYEKLDQLLHSLLKTRGVHHAVIGVESMDRSFRWSNALGQAHPDGTPMTVETPFWIASVTKLYIATAILKLWEAGALSLDDFLGAHLPKDMIEGLHQTKTGIDHSSKLTIKHLLTHTSGLPDYIELKPEKGKSLFTQVLEDGDRSWTIAESIKIVQDAKQPLFPPQPLSPGKKKARYSDTNFQLLIAIIEAVTGKPIHSVFDQLIYNPLNLRKTFHPGITPPEGLPPAAISWLQDRPLVDMPLAISSFRDLYSTTDDLLAFMRALILGEVFAKPATVQLMKSNWNTLGFLLSPVAPGWPMQYGMGMMHIRVPFPLSLLIPVPPVIGHVGATSAWLFYCPSLDLLIAGTVNQLTAGQVPIKVVQGLKRILGPEI